MGRAFGIESWKVNDAASLEPTLRKAVQSGAPAVIEVPTDRDTVGPWVPGWWDFPIPAYITTSARTDTTAPGPPSSTSGTAPPSTTPALVAAAERARQTVRTMVPPPPSAVTSSAAAVVSVTRVCRRAAGPT